MDDLELGSCCVCEGTENVTNIIFLYKRCLVPGTGWGDVERGLSFDGALAVVCDVCMEEGRPLVFAVDGYVSNHRRVKIEELTESFGRGRDLVKQEVVIGN